MSRQMERSGARRWGGLWVLVGVVLGLVVWLAAGIGVLRGGQTVPLNVAGKPLKIAVVDIRRVSEACRRTQDLRTALETQKRAKVEAIRALRQRINQAREDLKLLKKGKPAWKERKAQILRMEVEADVLSKLSLKELQDQNLEYTRQIYQAVLDEIARYAKEHDIDLVLRVGGDRLEARSLEELYRRMAMKSVLYAAPVLDITEEIRQAVDRAYLAEKRGQQEPERKR